MALIMIAEDESLLADLLADFLQDAGHEVLLAPHGAAALKLIDQRTPDLVLTDYMMPLMELAEEIRRRPDLSAMPIILMSGAQGYVAVTRPDLFDVVLSKPYTPKQLLRVVQGLLNGRSHSGGC